MGIPERSLNIRRSCNQFNQLRLASVVTTQLRKTLAERIEACLKRRQTHRRGGHQGSRGALYKRCRGSVAAGRRSWPVRRRPASPTRTRSEILTVLDVRRARLGILRIARGIGRCRPEILRTDAELAAPRRTPGNAEIQRGPAFARECRIVAAEHVADDRAAQ